tara:strand:- start:593 stop:847 length:255 start_codon:yes stop_codon:yes gene_type:complete
MEKREVYFPRVRRRPLSAPESIQRGHTAEVKHFMVAPDRVHHQLRLIVVRKPIEAKDGDGSGGKTLARDPGTTTTPTTRRRGMG